MLCREVRLSGHLGEVSLMQQFRIIAHPTSDPLKALLFSPLLGIEPVGAVYFSNSEKHSTRSRVFPYTSFVLYHFLRALKQNRAQ